MTIDEFSGSLIAKEELFRMPYEVMRMQTMTLVNIQIPKSIDKIKKPSDLYAFPWDEKVKSNNGGNDITTIEQKNEFFKRLNNR